MPTIYDELIQVSKITPKPGETFVDFATRLAGVVHKFDDETWETLSKPAQEWQNAMTEQLNERRALKLDGKLAEMAAVELPELDGFTMAPVTPAEGSTAKEKVTKVTKVKVKKAPAAAKMAKAKPAAVKAKGKRGRPAAYNGDSHIKLLVKDNPYRPHTIGAKVFEKYTNNMTCAEFAKAISGMRLTRKAEEFVRFDRKAKHIAVS